MEQSREIVGLPGAGQPPGNIAAAYIVNPNGVNACSVRTVGTAACSSNICLSSIKISKPLLVSSLASASQKTIPLAISDWFIIYYATFLEYG